VCGRSRLVQVVFVLTVISSRIISIHSCAHHQSRGYWKSPWRSDRASATRCGEVSAVVSRLATTVLTARAMAKKNPGSGHIAGIFLSMVSGVVSGLRLLLLLLFLLLLLLMLPLLIQISILLPVDCYCWQARIRVSCATRALLLVLLSSSIVERASRRSSKALSQTSAPESAPSAKGLAHDRMLGGIKGKRKSKKDKLRESSSQEASTKRGIS
jgi:hypothetical protein